MAQFKPNMIVAYTHNVSDGGIRVHKLPRPGETVRSIASGIGIDAAKGTNVAVAASRVGAQVALVAHVPKGDWFFRGKDILRKENIDDTFVIRDEVLVKSSGCIIIDDEGNNMIVLGSNSKQSLSQAEVDQALETYRDAAYCVTGYELDPACISYILETAHSLGIRTVLNPSPVPETKPAFWSLVDILVLNEVETLHMLKLAGVEAKQAWPENAAALKEAYGCKAVVITLGAEGFCALDAHQELTQQPGIPVVSTDTTGAGDGFLGAMVARLIAGDSLGQACGHANRFASCSVQKSGTISSYLTQQDWQAMLAEKQQRK